MARRSDRAHFGSLIFVATLITLGSIAAKPVFSVSTRSLAPSAPHFTVPQQYLFTNQWGAPSAGPLSNPSAIATDSANNVYILDTGNNRVLKFSSDGLLLLSWMNGGP